MSGHRTFFALAAALVLIPILACEREVIREIEVPGETSVVEKEATGQVESPGETIVVQKETINEVPVEVIATWTPGPRASTSVNSPWSRAPRPLPRVLPTPFPA